MTSQTFVLIDAQRKANCMQFLNNLPTDGTMEVLIQKRSSKRRDAQNRLMWHWNKEIAEQVGVSSKYVHGQNKLEILLPLMRGWGSDLEQMESESKLLQCIIDRVMTYEVQIFTAYRMIRSCDLTVNQFAEYLNEKERHWADQGVLLTTGDDIYYQAMGRVR